jgi:riboflavin-specific deaminase-like protein
VRRLLPEAAVTTLAELASGLRLGALAHPNRPWLALNMVSTVDGKAAIGGRTRPLSSRADRELFHLLRTQADAVMAGAGTVRAERYGRIAKSDELRDLRAREGLAREPLAVVVSGRLDLPADLPLLAARGQRVLVAKASQGELGEVEAELEYARTGSDLSALLRLLRERHQVRSVLCEGGPSLNRGLLAAGLVDELFLSLSPQLAGGAAALTIVAGEPLPAPVGLELVGLAEHEGELFARWRVRR